MRFRHRRNYGRHIFQCVKGETSLTNLAEGEKAVIIHAKGGCGVTRRLAEMGLTPGAEVKLLRKCPFHGPIQLEIRGVALALGYGIASKVFVRSSKEEADG